MQASKMTLWLNLMVSNDGLCGLGMTLRRNMPFYKYHISMHEAKFGQAIGI